MKINSLSKKYLSATLSAIFLILFGVVVIQFFTTQEINRRQLELSKKEIASTLLVYRREISEKISLLVSSQVFIDYLRSGQVTRDHLKLDVDVLLSSAIDESILGFEILNREESGIYAYGNTDGPSVQVTLCYLENVINEEFGSCTSALKIFFSLKGISERLQEINQSLDLCKSCELEFISPDSKLGSFTILKSDRFILPLGHRPSSSIEFFYILDFCFILVVLIVLAVLYFKFLRISEIYINAPLSKIIDALREKKLNDLNTIQIQEINYLARSLNQFVIDSERSDELKKNAYIGEIAKQVAHDIRSPLSALDMVFEDLESFPVEEKEVVKNSIIRINDIANSLLVLSRTGQAVESKFTKEHLISVIDSIVSEKRIQFRNYLKLDIQFQFDPGCYSVFVKINNSSVKTVLSNLINNSVEAIPKQEGLITISIRKENVSVVLEVKDSGTGIPPEIKDSLFKEPLTSGKANGNGLGLFDAKKIIEKVAGEICVESSKDGTLVKISFPLQNVPEWFCETLPISNDRIIVVDDDVVIHNSWKNKFKQSGIKNSIEYRSDFDGEVRKEALYLIDYNFNGKLYSGVDKIIEHDLSNSFLVTSHYQDIRIHDCALKYNFRIIPKPYLSFLPIVKI
jgi:signal transduction histidine kinase